jgi:hypothetical protein
MPLPSARAFEVEIHMHGADPVLLSTTIADLLQIISALQLALRHPELPPGIATAVQAFISAPLAQIETKSPIIADVIRAGNDPAQDIRPDTGERRGGSSTLPGPGRDG